MKSNVYGFETVIALADDALIAAQRLAEWCTNAPELEEEIALANIALDQLGAARLLLTHAGESEGAGRDEDALAYLRDEREYRNCLLVELPNGDFARTIAKLLFLSAAQLLTYKRLATTGDTDGLAAICAKAVKESAYHLDHARLWTLRLGDGTEISHARMQAAVDELWPYTHELTGPVGLADRAPAGLVDLVPVDLVPVDLVPVGRVEWLSVVEPVLVEATVRRPADGWAPGGGRHGTHTEHMGFLLAEMQVLHRAHPGAKW